MIAEVELVTVGSPVSYAKNLIYNSIFYDWKIFASVVLNLLDWLMKDAKSL